MSDDSKEEAVARKKSDLVVVIEVLDSLTDCFDGLLVAQPGVDS